MLIRRRTVRLALHQKSTTVTFDGLHESAGPQLVPSKPELEEQSVELQAGPRLLESGRGGPRHWLGRLLASSRRGRHLPLLFVLGLCSTLVTGPAAAQTPIQTFYVNSTNDTVDQAPGDGKCATGNLLSDGKTPECTLRAAVDEVNALAGQSTTSGTYAISMQPGTYKLSTTETCNFNPLSFRYESTTTTKLCLNANLILQGADPATTIVDGGALDGIFFLSSGLRPPSAT